MAEDVKNFTRGGQITLHNIRMFIQIMDKVALFVGIIFIGVFVSSAWLLTSEYERYVFGQYLWANTLPIFDPTVKVRFIQPNGSASLVRYLDIANSTLIHEIVKQTSRHLLIAVCISIAASLASLSILTQWLRQRGKKQAEDTLLKGDNIIPSDVLANQLVKSRCDSDLKLAGLPLIKNKETAHFIFNGTTGTGKSNAIKEMLDQIRSRGDRVVVYDKSCSFFEEYYRPNVDVLLNPLDARGESWDLWKECRDSADFDSLAAAQIPMPLSNQDPFWINAARTIFSAVAYEMRNDEDRSISKLLNALLSSDLASIQKYLKGTEAETLTSDKIEKTAVSIKSVLATYLKSLKYVKDDSKPFTIRNWIQDDVASNWLFITSLGDRHETLKPLISSWLDIAVNALLSLPADPKRRIWLILDELTSLQPLPYLTQTLSESRKFGGCVVIGVQNHAQLCKLYGNDGAREISALLNTRVMFRQPDPDMAKWAAQNFGENVKDEVREGISYGANTMRDGVSINRVETQKQLISYSEIMGLADLEAFIRLPGQYPLSRIKFSYTERQSMNIPFVLRNYDLKKAANSEESFSSADEDKDTLPFVQKKKQKKKAQITELTTLKVEPALDI